MAAAVGDDLFEDEDFLNQIDSLVQNYNLAGAGTSAQTQSEKPRGTAAATTPPARTDGEGRTSACGVRGDGVGPAPKAADDDDDVFEDDDFLNHIDSIVQSYHVEKSQEEKRRRESEGSAGTSQAVVVAEVESAKERSARTVDLAGRPSTGTKQIALSHGRGLVVAGPRGPTTTSAALAPSSSVRLDASAAESWILPSDPQARPYQQSITRSCLFTNTLVCLPTGLGKTLVAAVVMANYRRWFPQGIVIFTAPTRPLVHQQIDACTKIMRIPKESTVELTGRRTVDEREAEWRKSAIFFATPQIVENDILKGICPKKRVVCVVFDECHRAVGKHAYAAVAKHLNRAGVAHRCLGLSATPGADRRRLQEVVANLRISKVEFRSENDEEIRDYVHHRQIEKRTVDPSGGGAQYDDLRYWRGDMKLCELRRVLAEHFAGSPTKNVIVFCSTRERVHDIVAALEGEEGIKAAAFIGQGNSAGAAPGARGKAKKGKGMNQKTQQEVLKRFRKGLFNLLVATCVAEEGLDIPEVGLIICYDPSVSPGRNIQRMGRTGRKEEGRVVYLLTQREKQDYDRMEEREKQIHSALRSGQLNLSLSPRMLPHRHQPQPVLMGVGEGVEKSENENDSTEKGEVLDEGNYGCGVHGKRKERPMVFDFIFPSNQDILSWDATGAVSVKKCPKRSFVM